MKWHGRNASKMLRRVLSEYGWVCHICGLSIDPEAKPRTPGYPTADHIIPRSHGGSNTLDNLRPAHWSCNSRRGNRVLTRLSRPAWSNPDWP